MGKNGDLGLSELKIQEKTDVVGVSMEDWIGPANAIDGYVPRRVRDKIPEVPRLNTDKQGGKQEKVGTKNRLGDPNVQDIIFHDESIVSKTATPRKPRGNLTSKDVNCESKQMRKSDMYTNETGTNDNVKVLEDVAGPSQSHCTGL